MAGEDVAFASSNPDREVVAHELAHVVQQRGGGTPVQASSTVSTAQDASEREADAVAGVGAGGGWVAPGALQALPGAGIQRAPPTPGEGPAPSTTPSSGATLTPSPYNLDPGTESDLKAAEAFVAAGVKEKKGFVPSTNSGGFDAKYDPGSGDGTLTITVQEVHEQAIQRATFLATDGFQRHDTSDPSPISKRHGHQRRIHHREIFVHGTDD